MYTCIHVGAIVRMVLPPLHQHWLTCTLNNVNTPCCYTCQVMKSPAVELLIFLESVHCLFFFSDTELGHWEQATCNYQAADLDQTDSSLKRASRCFFLEIDHMLVILKLKVCQHIWAPYPDQDIKGLTLNLKSVGTSEHTATQSKGGP